MQKTGIPWCEQIDEGLLLRCHVQPGASSDAIQGVHNNRLKVRIKAPPVDGKANKHLLVFIAGKFGITKKNIRIVTGESSREKSLFIEGVSQIPGWLYSLDTSTGLKGN